MNEKNLENKIKNLTYMVLIGFIAVIILLIGLYFKDGSTTKTSTGTGNSGTTSTTYDVSKMNAVSVDGAVALFDKEGTYVLYIGRSDCPVCVTTVPVLNQVQEELGYTTNYFDLNKTTNFRTEMAELADKFTIDVSVNGEDGTIGELFIDHGYTPTIIIIKDGKVVDGFIGYKDYDTFKALVSKYI